MISTAANVTSPPGSLLYVIEQEHSAEMCLCNMLERLADALPEPLDTEIATAGITTLRNCVRRHIILEEQYLYPVLMTRVKKDEFNEDLLALIAREHASDESHAHEAADEMEAALLRGQVPKPEMLGYMLRGFFEARRRHIAWENAVIIPLARQRLTRSDYEPFSVTELEQNLGQDLFAGLSKDKRCGCLQPDEE